MEREETATTEAKIKVLIADDHPLLREALLTAFAKCPDIQVVGQAANGEEAVKLAASTSPDVVVMDIVMPGMNGIEATREIRDHSPRTAILVLTAYDDDRYVVGLLQAGASGYLLKSSRGEALTEAVRMVCAGESVLHPNVIAKMLKYGGPGGASGRALEPITEREMEVLRLAARGLGNKDIARELSLSARTVKAHLSNIFIKMNVASRTEAIIKGVRQRWLTLDNLPVEKQDTD